MKSNRSIVVHMINSLPSSNYLIIHWLDYWLWTSTQDVLPRIAVPLQEALRQIFLNFGIVPVIDSTIGW